jgi:alpha-galactosidase
VLAQLAMPEFMIPERIRIPYLNKDSEYEVTIIDRPPTCGNLMKKEPAWLNKKIILSGEILNKIGLQLPVMNPESIILLGIKIVS